MPRLLLVLAVLAVTIYLVVSLAQRRGRGPSWRRPRRSVGPDDDPTFLRDLDDQLWRDRHRRDDGGLDPLSGRDDQPDGPPDDRDQPGAA